MSKKRMLTTVASLGLAASLVAACGSGGSGTDGGSGGQTNADGTTPVEMWVFAELHAEYYEQMAEQWNETNPDE